VKIKSIIRGLMFLNLAVIFSHDAFSAAAAAAGFSKKPSPPSRRIPLDTAVQIASFLDVPDIIKYGSTVAPEVKKKIDREMMEKFSTQDLQNKGYFEVIDFAGKASDMPEDYVSPMSKGKPILGINPSAEQLKRWAIIRQLTVLRLLGEDSEAKLTALMEILPKTDIIDLDLFGVRIDHAGAEALSKYLPESSVRKLALSSSEMPADVMEVVIRGLPSSKVRHLNLFGNSINREAGNILAEVLPKTKILSLDLSSTKMDSETMQTIFKVLPGTEIKRLYFEQNTLDSAAIEVLLDALRDSRITDLDLSRMEGMTITDTTNVIAALPETKVENLNLFGVRVNDEVLEKLEEVIPTSNLKEITLFPRQFEFRALLVDWITRLSELFPDVRFRKNSIEDY